MIKAFTLGRVGDRSEVVNVFATRSATTATTICSFGVDVEKGTLDRLRPVLRTLGIQSAGIEIDVFGDRAELVPRSSDLAIAVAVAAVEEGALAGRLADVVLLGELGPEGELLPVQGALLLLAGLSSELTPIAPRANGFEAAGAGVRVLVADTLGEVLEHLRGHRRPLAVATEATAE